MAGWRIVRTSLLLAASCTMTPTHGAPTLPTDAVRLHIVGPDDADMTTAQVTLVRVERAAGVCATTMPARPQRRTLSPADFDRGVATIAQLPAGSWALLVDEGHFAPTLSTPFELPADAGRELTVQLTPGATVTGVLRDDAQRPIANARCELIPPRGAGLTTLCVSSGNFPEPVRIGRTVTTAADGTFTLAGLAAGDYELRVEPKALDGASGTLRVDAGERRQLAPLVLSGGAEVSGAVTVEGHAMADVKVTLGVRLPDAPPRDDGLDLSPWRSFAAFTAADGSYRFDGPIPAGTWRISASRKSPDDPFAALLDLRRSACTVEMPAGTRQWSRSFDL